MKTRKKERKAEQCVDWKTDVPVPALVFRTEEEERKIFSGDGYIPPRLRGEKA